MIIIMAVNLSSIDLNLFLVLHAVLEERSATRAAARLNVTQSAVSNALAPLLREATDCLALAIDRRGFIATETTRTFTIALSDNYQASDVPRIAHALAVRMPRATLRVVSTDYLAASDGLASGDIDVAFSPEQAVQSGMRSAALFEERAALIVRRDHPRVGTR